MSSAFLLEKDYYTQIQKDVLVQITENDKTIRQQAEFQQIAFMKSFLRQRYDVEKAFAPIDIWNPLSSYAFDKVVMLSASKAYDVAGSYSVNELVFDASTGLVYIYLGPDNFGIVGTQGAFYKMILEGGGTNYPNDVIGWQEVNDPRNADLVMILIDLVLFQLYSRLSNRNIPDIRLIRYDGNNQNQVNGAIGWLKKVASGEYGVDLPLIDATSQEGASITWGSNTKLNHTW